MAKRKRANKKLVGKIKTAQEKFVDQQSSAYAVNYHSPLLENLSLNLVSKLPRLFDTEIFTLVLEHDFRIRPLPSVPRCHK